MSKLKRSRALRRNLRKQARKGTLSARERKTLLQQEKRFRKARRPFMRGLGFGAGLGTGALLVPGVAGLISGLGGLRPGKEDPDEDPGQDPEVMEDELGRNPNALFYDVEEQPSNQVVGGPGAVEDVVVVGEGEEEEKEEEEAPAAEETTEPVMSREEAERQAAQVTAPRVDEFGSTVPADMDDDEVLERLARSRTLYPQVPIPEGSTDGMMEYFSNPTPGALERLAARDEAEQAPTDYTGGFKFGPSRRPVRRPAVTIPMDRPDPRMGSTLDPRLPGVIDRARRSPLFMQQGGRIDKSNDLVARIKRKYGLR